MDQYFCDPGLNDLRGRSLGEAMARLQLEAWDKSKRQRGWMTRCHLTVLPSGRIHVAYKLQPGADTGRSIKHVSLDPDWVNTANHGK